MLFLDKKEEVLDIELTPFGKYKLSIGEFKPVHYAFFDGDILYDPECAELTGSQNSIEGRIQEDTPRLQAQYVFEGRETAILRGNEIAISSNDFFTVGLGGVQPTWMGAMIAPGYSAAARRRVIGKTTPRVINTLNGDVLYYPDAQTQQLQAYYQQNFFQKYQYMIETTTRDKHYSLTAPIGTSDLASQKSPKWTVSLLSGEISNAERVLTGSYQTEQIPQVNITLTYDTMVANVDPTKNILPLDGIDPELSSDVFPDGTYIAVRPEYLLAEIKEEYANYTNENFDVEVMEESTQTMLNVAGPAGTEVPYFSYLYFEPEEITVRDGILLDKPIIPVAKDIGAPSKFVGYFMDVLVDDEIDQTIICNAIENLKVRDIYIDTGYECPDVERAVNASIYVPSDEVCPVDIDTSGKCEV